MVTVLATPSWTLAGSQQFNVIDDNGVTWGISSTEGYYDGTDITVNSAAIPRGDGAYRSDSFRGPRTMVLNGWAQAPSLQASEQAQRSLKGLFLGGGLYPLRWDGEFKSRVTTVELAAVPRIRPVGNGLGFDFQLTLFAADPRHYFTAAVSVSNGLATGAGGLNWVDASSGGLTWAVNGGLNWGTASGGSVTVQNTGTDWAWPIFTLTGQLTSPTITRQDGYVIAYSQTIGSTDAPVVISTSLYSSSVLQGGGDVRPNVTIFQFQPIAPGVAATYYLTSLSGADTGSLTVGFTPSDQ